MATAKMYTTVYTYKTEWVKCVTCEM